MTSRSGRLDLTDGITQAVTLCGKMFAAHVSGALYWPGEDTLIVADLHLGKAASAAAKGRYLPPYEPRETLMRLAEVLDRFEPATVVCLGDSLHDRQSAARLAHDDIAILRLLQEDRRWIWITGNHDPEIATALGGEVHAAITPGGLTLRHEPLPGPVTHEIAAHLHPAAKITLHGHTIRKPCFVSNGRRLILPAFGVLTGGLNILDDAFEPLFGRDGLHVFVLGDEGLYPVAPRLLRDD